MEDGNLPTLTAECLLVKRMDSWSSQSFPLRGKRVYLKEKACMTVSIARARNAAPLEVQGALPTSPVEYEGWFERQI